MTKLVGIEPKGGYQLALHFSDGVVGVLDFTLLVNTGAPMTEPLRDPAFFARYFIELGALAWPNGLEFSAGSLYLRLQEAGRLAHGKRMA